MRTCSLHALTRRCYQFQLELEKLLNYLLAQPYRVEQDYGRVELQFYEHYTFHYLACQIMHMVHLLCVLFQKKVDNSVVDIHKSLANTRCSTIQAYSGGQEAL
ncbi:hypothetical protein VTK73DRAFT_1894 [Phialemonium thermophilum]|uniref:Uncharacterized protein n=1 Tax=Phialemonium thermophilum TaxID=223376 RepID=A0ABR3Y317_9PEZI